MYEYRATVDRVIDGDTVVFAIDLGLQVTVTEPCRMRGYDAPEVRGEQRAAGLAAKKRLTEMLIEPIIIRTHKDRTGKYGRYLVEVFAAGENVNEMMVEEGWIK